MNKYYAGIGARATPPEILDDMTEIAVKLSDQYTLRSGHADGADEAFALGAKTAQIWLPWSSFNVGKRKDHHEYRVVYSDDTEAYNSLKLHPNANNLTSAVCSLMARNYRQIVGRNQPNSEFVICWTPRGEVVGGTAQALRIAKLIGIPVFNLALTCKDEIFELIERNGQCSYISGHIKIQPETDLSYIEKMRLSYLINTLEGLDIDETIEEIKGE